MGTVFDDFSLRRHEMVETLRRYGISNPRVLEAFATVERHRFFPEEGRAYAYDDTAYPIGYGQTISQPFTVAYMTSLLVERASEGKVLEVGTGSGYQAALLDALGYRVWTIERVPALAEQARRRFEEMALPIVSRQGDGSLGWPEEAPFEGIIVTAGAPVEPMALSGQLADGGCMVIPVGDHAVQWMTVLTRRGGSFETERFQQFAFVPLIGREGWDEYPEER